MSYAMISPDSITKDRGRFYVSVNKEIKIIFKIVAHLRHRPGFSPVILF